MTAETDTDRYWRLAVRPCRCAHSSLAHQHLRDGTDCAFCHCNRFRWAWWRTLLR
jgi:hypothetical protein